MDPLRTPHPGRYRARLAAGPADLAAAQALRGRAFGTGAVDGDDLDPRFHHLLIEEAATGTLAATCRFQILPDGAGIGGTYAARFYDLSRLRGFGAPMMEMGRFCVDPAHGHPDVLRVAWAALGAQVRDEGVQLLFGCSSFAGTETAAHAEAFALLRERHLAPRRWLPRVKAPQVFRFARALRALRPDPRRAMAAMPPLLRSYLAMGGWVSDHAVVDRQLNTLHVFTGVEVAAIPPARARWMGGFA